MSGLICNPSTLCTSWMQYLWNLSTQPTFWMQDCFPSVVPVCVCLSLRLPSTCVLTRNTLLFFFPPSDLKMASILQKLITPLFSGPPEPPRNKVTVVGVGQVGMACAVSILLRVRAPLVFASAQMAFLLVSQDGVIPRILWDWHRITDLLVSGDLAGSVMLSLSLLRCGHNDGKMNLTQKENRERDNPTVKCYFSHCSSICALYITECHLRKKWFKTQTRSV